MTHRPPLHTDLVMTMPDGSVTDGRFTTLTALHNVEPSDDYEEQPRFYRRTEAGWEFCKAPLSWRLQSEVSSQPEVL